jgi:hypothetical protein
VTSPPNGIRCKRLGNVDEEVLGRLLRDAAEAGAPGAA